MIKEVELIKIPLQVQTILDDCLFIQSTLEAQKIQDQILKGMILQLKAYALAEELASPTKEVIFTSYVPANRWEGIKVYLIPGWLYRLLRLKPVHFNSLFHRKTVTFKHVAIYPEAIIAIPDVVGNKVRFRSWMEESDA